MAELNPNGPPYAGALYECSREGFAKMLTEANNAVRIGYELIAIERIGGATGGQLGAVFRKQQRGVRDPGDAARLLGE